MDGNFKGESQSSQAFKFTGDGGRYFLICLVNSLLVFITLVLPATGADEMSPLYLF